MVDAMPELFTLRSTLVSSISPYVADAPIWKKCKKCNPELKKGEYTSRAANSGLSFSPPEVEPSTPLPLNMPAA